MFCYHFVAEEDVMKKIWISGANGHVGQALKTILEPENYELLLTDKEEVDITVQEDVHQYMKLMRPDVLINCSGLTNLEECIENEDEAYHVNAIGARNLAAEAHNMNCKMIQLSTDDVFDCKEEQPINEFVIPSPTSVYGKSKYAGERFITSLNEHYVIIRSSWVYGTGHDYVDDVLTAVQKNTPIEASVNEFASPTSALELAKTIIFFIDHDYFGIYHCVCKGSCSRYEFAKEILRNINSDLEVIPNHSKQAHRSHYSVLDNMMLRLDGIGQPCDWKEALQHYLTHGGQTID